MTGLIRVTDSGLYCPAGDFYIDPSKPVPYAVITHGHADHARWGSKKYLATDRSLDILQIRLGRNAALQTLPWNSPITHNGVTLSFHPAGHILGSAQIRIESNGEVVVVSGDYKTQPNPTCDAFESIPCHTFVSESTFGNPRFVWPDETEIWQSINTWWSENAERGVTSILFAYALGKAQRILAGLNPAIGPIAVHRTIHRLNSAYLKAGVSLAANVELTPYTVDRVRRKGLVIAPPSVLGTPWLKQILPYTTAFASGWMLLPEQQSERGVDRGFVLSDHADWDGLIEAITSSKASEILLTHGKPDELVAWGNDRELNVRELC